MRDRIKSLRRVKASELRRHPRNPKNHTDAQRAATSAVLDRLGLIGAAIARETPQGLELIDGHLRADILDDEKIPVLIVDLDDDETAEALVFFDGVGDLAEVDDKLLQDLLATLGSIDDEGPLDEMLAALRSEPEPTIEDEAPATEERTVFDDYVDFRIGDYSGKIGKPVYESFIAAYQTKQVESGEPILDDVLRAWLCLTPQSSNDSNKATTPA